MTKVAIVGGGPRGLWAAEELLTLARERSVDIELHVFNDFLGVAYQPDQPKEWLMNVRSSIITTQFSDFDRWLQNRGVDSPFPPRRLVGEFLAESWDTLSGYVPRGCSLTIHSVHVEKIEPLNETDDSWLVQGELFDEVLLATGHATDWPGALSQEDVPAGVRLITSPYPASNLNGIGVKDRVLVRGAALTFIDIIRVCLPAVFIPVTRTGQLMKPKPDFSGLYLDDILNEGSEKVRSAKNLCELKVVLRVVSTQIQERAGKQDEEWGMGVAWREMYPSIVKRASYEGRDSLKGFYDLAREMERLAFGPPPESYEHLQRLIDSGVVDTSHLHRGEERLADLVRELNITVVIDAVTSPPGVVPGTLVHYLVEEGYARVRPGTRGLDVAADGTVIGQKHLAAVGRMTEDVVLGNDTLSRTLHDVIPKWARRVIRNATPLPERVHGIPPLAARLEPWAKKLTSDPTACRTLITNFGSPVNVLHAGVMARNIAELVDTGNQMGVDTRVFFARKANKGLTFVDAVKNVGHGIDVASERELFQVLNRDVPGAQIILSAAIKPDSLLELAIANDVVISADSRDELDRIAALVGDRIARVMPRVAPDPAVLPPTRFGERAAEWAERLTGLVRGVDIVGLHVHLHGYAAEDRALALRECCQLIDSLREYGHSPQFIDLGGGVPMSYIESDENWVRYQYAKSAVLAGYAKPFTWKDVPPSNTYPFYQTPVRGEWLKDLLSNGVAQLLIDRGLRLHLEPGRSLLDGCGIILAEVAFVKTRSDGLPLVGLAMNRTQCRTTSDDYLIDPLHITDNADGSEIEAYLVGAYCIEDELILRRRIRFPHGVKPGDIIGIPNTAGYFMHILESASHQIPLAKNVVWPEGILDDIDID
ncbi:FAD/NAD(P)-binding protein [Corynebacterium crudilactis]|uniref:Diaminopimelate decarboxylase n=1 Tax=Corynebacterium crudilactis TaxID=1652495 RepID=A0A172QUP8_9CORY|nr:FAD/NAD(P)-binding protein [Corynebacterium crudilactis]ANE04381.1 diaminopimelate decarboxylase [Corynebacterium crudilactis]